MELLTKVCLLVSFLFFDGFGFLIFTVIANIVKRAKSDLTNMSLTTWKVGRVRKEDFLLFKYRNINKLSLQMQILELT